MCSGLTFMFWMEEQMGNKYYERKSAGLCVKCGRNSRADGALYCEECKVRINALITSRRKYLMSIGMCSNCLKNKKDSGYCLCSSCRERARRKKREKSEQRLENGLCPQCGKYPAKNGGMCVNCRKYMKRWREGKKNES